MQNISFEILENLIMANEMFLGDDGRKRNEYQHTAIAKLKILDALAMAAREQQCILPKQYEILSRYISDCTMLTGAWINSDKKRVK